MTIETLSEDAITRLVDRAMIAEAEKRAVQKSLAAKTNEVAALEGKLEKAEARAVDVVLGAARNLEYAVSSGSDYFDAVGCNMNVTPEQRIRLNEVTAKLRATLTHFKKQREVERESQAKWNNNGVLEGAAIALCYINEAIGGRRSEKGLDQIVEVIRGSAPDGLDKALQVRSALVALVDKLLKSKKTKK